MYTILALAIMGLVPLSLIAGFLPRQEDGEPSYFSLTILVAGALFTTIGIGLYWTRDVWLIHRLDMNGWSIAWVFSRNFLLYFSPLIALETGAFIRRRVDTARGRTKKAPKLWYQAG